MSRGSAKARKEQALLANEPINLLILRNRALGVAIIAQVHLTSSSLSRWSFVYRAWWKEGWKFSNFSFFSFFLFFSFSSLLIPFLSLSRFLHSFVSCGRSNVFFFFFLFSLSLSLHANPRHRLWTKLFVKIRRVFFNNTWPTLSLNALFHLGTLERAKASLMSLHPRKLVFNASARPTGSMNFSLEEGTLKVSVPFSTDSGSPMPPPPPRSLASLVFSSSCNWCSRRVRKVNRHFFLFFFFVF